MINLAMVLLSLLFMAVILELALRLMPVVTTSAWEPVNQQSPTLRYHGDITLTYSNGWDFSLHNRRRVNDHGFLNDQNYAPDDPRGLLAVIGDSYVEAFLNPYEKTFYGRLAAQANEQSRVYSFGVSGAPLSQYLHWAGFVKETFAPDALVVSIIANDFDESFYRYKRTRGLHYFAEGESGEPARLIRVDREDSWIRKLLFSSSLVRYLFFHLQLGDVLKNAKDRLVKLWTGDDTPERFIGNVVAEVPEVQERDGRRATDLFLEALPRFSGLSPRKIVFVLDGVRPSLYDDADLRAAQGSYWWKMREHFIERARAAGYGVVDMQEPFRAHYREHQRRFEYEQDGHWNDLAHGLVAAELRQAAALQHFFAESSDE